MKLSSTFRITLLTTILFSGLVLAPHAVSHAEAVHPASHVSHTTHLRAVPHRHHRSTVLSVRFPILAFAGTATRGRADVIARGSLTSVTVSVQGLGAMSSHSIHIHAGSCDNPYAGVHLYVLGTITANGAGAGVVSGPGPNPYVPGGRYVIVYATLFPNTIVGCANLGPLHAP